jgi:hypothetical protein
MSIRQPPSEMAHHKRKGPKSTRAGCLHCKPHKHQAERHRERSRGKRRWRAEQAAAAGSTLAALDGITAKER